MSDFEEFGKRLKLQPTVQRQRKVKANQSVVKADGWANLWHDGPFGLSYSTVQVNSPQWRAWLRIAKTFTVDIGAGSYNARREQRPGTDKTYWYAFRAYEGKTHKIYIGKPEELTFDRLREVVNQMMDKIGAYQEQLPGDGDEQPLPGAPD